jgi:hypothetical protein
MSDLVLQHPVGWKPDRVADALGFEELVYLGIGEGCITTEIQPLHDAAIAGDRWLQYYAPAISAMDVTRSQSVALNIAELVEHEQWVIAGVAEMAVVGAAFLVAVGRALARIHVEHDDLWRSPLVAPCQSIGRADRRALQGSRVGSATSSRSGPSGWPRRQTR